MTKFSDDELEADEAHAKLRDEIIDFIKYALQQGATAANPLCAGAAATPGLGKTSISLKLIADLLQGRTVYLFEPSLEMAAKTLADAKQLGIDAVMIRGREANNGDPVRWPSQCWKADVAAIVARAGYSVWRTLCRRRDKKSGQTYFCEYFGECPYTMQFTDLDGKLIILVHNYLSLTLPVKPHPDFAFIDEKFHRVCLKELSLPLARVTMQHAARYGVSDCTVANLAHDAKIALQALEAGKSMLEVGLTAKRLKIMAFLEERLEGIPEIRPDMPYAEQRELAKLLHEGIDTLRCAKLWRVLADNADRVTSNIKVSRNIEYEGKLDDRVFIYWREKLQISSTTPTILIDADLDPHIAEIFFPHIRIIEINSRLNATVTQVGDQSFSRNKLLERRQLRRDVIAMARVRAARGLEVLIATYKQAEDLMRAEMQVRPWPADSLIHLAHFNGILGRDDWKDCDVVIVAGRGEQMAPWDADRQLLSLHNGNASPVCLAGKDYVLKERSHLLRNGKRTKIPVQEHPDLLGQALVEQARECELEQAVGRLRLPFRKKPAEVILLSNLPTRRLKVDRLATWLRVVPSKLEQALAWDGGILPLSYPELSRIYPWLWSTVESCRNSFRSFLSARPKVDKGSGHDPKTKGGESPNKKSILTALLFLIWEFTTLSELTLVSYRRPGQTVGSAQKAVLPGRFEQADLGAARELLVGVVGEVAQFRILDVILRPGVFEAAPDAQPEPFVFLGLRTLKIPADGIAPPDEFVIVPPRHGRPQWEQRHKNGIDQLIGA